MNYQQYKFDIDKEEVVRDENGLCIKCQPGEVGELLGFIDDEDPLRKFQGYTNKQATEKKILRDVVTKGDKWFRTGDLLSKDEQGYFYFVDRIGDTFRWKGENVSTSEIEQIAMQYPYVQECTVYGVKIANTEGRAGMILVVPKPEFDLREFYKLLKKELANYAVPYFVRLSKEIVVTSTFKHMKAALVEEGYNPETVSDPLYYRSDEHETFLPLDKTVYLNLGSYAKL
eukprot:TRINITY_DN1234_c0_g1_i5.p1 TRINITY_DN1234_c0_g1~~TRINITY_DN1234_c0_g1_i5.p1  ORF type:complete len:229 (-),score=41.98 TRINITY_DN1234_c0_g1_i5:67-753(-)